MPEVRPFRALRFDAERVPDLSSVIAPPYDVISPAKRAELADRDPRNIVAIELPEELGGDEPQDRYRRAARSLAAWRSEGVLRKDPRPAWYVYEQSYRVPETNEERVQRGYFGLIRLAPFGEEHGILAHERTLEAPREDRYRLLRATGANISPVVGLYDDPAGTTGSAIAAATERQPSAVAADEAVRHRLWVIPADEGATLELPLAAGRGPIVIADGHHRYETALRYRDERRMTRSCEEDPPFDWVLMLLLSTSEPLTILATHRLIHGLDAGTVGRLPDLVAQHDAVEAIDRSRITPSDLGPGRFVLLTAEGAWRIAASGSGADALDVTVLGGLLERTLGIGADAVAAGRLSYTISISDAIGAVDAGTADGAFLLAPTAVDDVLRIARRGEVLPQKSTYFYPKAPAGLVLNPHEW